MLYNRIYILVFFIITMNVIRRHLVQRIKGPMRRHGMPFEGTVQLRMRKSLERHCHRPQSAANFMHQCWRVRSHLAKRMPGQCTQHPDPSFGTVLIGNKPVRGAILTQNRAWHRQAGILCRKMIKSSNLHIDKAGLAAGAHHLQHPMKYPVNRYRGIQVEFAVQTSDICLQPIDVGHALLPVGTILV